MAPTETKFHISRIFLSTAVFISLCVSSEAGEGRRCYWCGPLAEQVHRSQRAPPCDSPTQVTVCDSGFPYCAVVATSPPYMESRYCVKLYQDECYSLYCNSTRTWRITCPCRGDLCNGPNTYREEDAFAGLAKLVARTQKARLKRALLSSSGFINMNTNRKNRIDNTTTLENNSNETENKISNGGPGPSRDVDTNMENQIDNAVPSTAVVETGSQDTESNSFTDDASKNEVSLITTPETFSSEQIAKNNSDDNINETSIQIDIPTVNAESSDLKTEIILMSSEATKRADTKAKDVTTGVPDVETTPIEIIKKAVIETTNMVKTTTESAPTTYKTKIEDFKVKPSDQLPAAEALQHDETPSTKTSEKTTMSTTVVYIQHTATTEMTKPRNNTAVRIEAHVLTLAVSIILHY